MTHDFLATLTSRFHAYLDTFRQPDGALPEMLQLKLDHTVNVVKNVRLVMSGEGWPDEARRVGEACAWLHDVGRFSQLRDYNTFQDAKSIDHAVRSVEVVEAGGWLEGLEAAERKRVLTAVALHNKKEVPAALEAETSHLCHAVRDADKLDIFRVLEVAATDGSLSRNPEIAWELQVKGAPSPEVVEAVSKGLPVCYTWIRTLSDFVLIQVGWLHGGFRYRTSLRLARERRVLEFREAYLKTLSDDPGVSVCCEAARTYSQAQLDGQADG
jgi:hypothetical protein